MRTWNGLSISCSVLWLPCFSDPVRLTNAQAKATQTGSTPRLHRGCGANNPKPAGITQLQQGVFGKSVGCRTSGIHQIALHRARREEARAPLSTQSLVPKVPSYHFSKHQVPFHKSTPAGGKSCPRRQRESVHAQDQLSYPRSTGLEKAVRWLAGNWHRAFGPPRHQPTRHWPCPADRRSDHPASQVLAIRCPAYATTGYSR